MATVRQRASGYWQAIVRKKGYPDESRTFRTKTEAQDWGRSVEADMQRGLFQSSNASEQITIGSLIEDFKIDFAPLHYRSRPDNKEAWRFQLDRINEVLGKYSLAAIDQKLIASYRDLRLRGSSTRIKVNDGTVRKELYMISKLLGFAQNEKGITLPRGNPVEKIRKPSEPSGRDRRLTNEEWAKLETECKNSRNLWLWPAVSLALETAMRQGELLNLRWSDINKKNRIAMLLDSKKLKNEEPRAVPLSPLALDTLNALSTGIKSDGLVLKVERQTLYRAFQYACDRAGISNYTFHDLRHEAISRLAERGDFNVLELAAVSGHKTLQMLKRYTHLQASKLAEKMAAFPN